MISTRLTILWTTLAALLVASTLAIIPVSAQAATGGDLCWYGTDLTGDSGEAMMPGTSPQTWDTSSYAGAVIQTASGYYGAVYDNAQAPNISPYQMDPKSSPTVSVSNGTAAVAFVAANDELYTGDGSQMTPSGEYVRPGSSPSSVGLANGAAEYIFINSSGNVALGTGSSWTATGATATPGSSPAIAPLTGGGWEAAYEGSGNLYLLDDSLTSADTYDGMPASGSTPDIAGLSGTGSYDVAFNNGEFIYLDNSGTTTNTYEGIDPGTSPSITPVSSGSGYDIAFQSGGHLWLTGNTGTINTGLAMAPGTSPSITATSSGYEVAYQCAPATAPVTTTVVTTAPSSTTSPVTTTTPAGTGTTTTKSKQPRLKARLGFEMTWTGTSSHIIRVSSAVRLPRSAVVSVVCVRTRAARCPKLGAAPSPRKRTLARELAVVDGRTYARNVVLRFTVKAAGYETELISVRLPGNGLPKSTTTWK